MNSTTRDEKVRELFLAGRKGREIAAALGVSETTVWYVVRRLELSPRRGCYVRPGCSKELRELMRQARKYGPVDFDAADLPGGGSGYIAFIGDRPGPVEDTQVEALRSALAVWK